MTADEFRFGAVILAAGKSSRMGRPKMLLPWRGTTVLGHLAEQWNTLGALQAGIVCGLNDLAVRGELDRLGIPDSGRIYNETPERGMFSSIRCAASWPYWLPRLTHLVVVLGDQPHLRNETLALLLQFSCAHKGDICQPSRAGRARHPVVLPCRVFFELAEWQGENLKQFLSERTVALFESEDVGLDLDVDRPDDYQKALEIGFGASTSGPPGENT